MSKQSDLRGIFPAMITPFTDDGAAVDTNALASHTKYLLDAGVGGLIPGGSTGEFTSLCKAERELVHSTVVEAAAGRAPVIPQTGAMTAREAIELSVHAERVGAAGVMVVPPYYDRLTFLELKGFYTEVAGAISIPVMIYHIPGSTGQHLSTAEIGELAQIPGVSSIKYSSGDAAALYETLELYRDRLQVCTGWDTLTFFGLAAGVRAAVWGAANIFPELAVELYEAVAERRDLVEGRKIWSRVYPVVAFLEAESYAARVKAACTLVGLQIGAPRRPLLPVNDGDLNALRTLLQQAGLEVR
jgi:dihydrodipicolinate synthase/N-acetylneuraminate lyase